MFPRIPMAGILALAVVLPLTFCRAVEARPLEIPKSDDPNLVVELVAREPQIRTPTAVQVAPDGRIWVLENNTHFRPKNYDGAPTDRVLVFEDFAADGHAQKVTVVADGFRDGMGLRLLPGGDAIVSTRAEVFRLHGNEKTTLLKLETTDNYPHNGLSGMAVSAEGLIYVGLGENHGSPWTLTGSDGATITGSDEGGIFRCDPEGKKLERWALGFWNPFGLAFDQAGRLFVQDNDPGAGSLCRLLHVVKNGDYGFRYRYGRTAEHPFLSWYGQIRGTLPPITLTGEAPTQLLQYSGGALGSEYAGELLGCTWDDHGVQRFHLQPKGASFSTTEKWLIRGGYYFRPTGIAQAPDGSLIVSDWVDGSYEVHGNGRLWRIRSRDRNPAPAPATPLAKLSTAEEKVQTALAGSITPEDALAMLVSDDPYFVHGAIDFLARAEQGSVRAKNATSTNPKVRLGILLASRRSGKADEQSRHEQWLRDPDQSVRRAALQWIGEERLATWKDRAELALQGQPSARTFQAYLASLQLIASGKPDNKVTAAETVKVALDSSRPPELRALALRLAPIEHPDLPLPKLRELISDKDPNIGLEAVRLIAARTSWETQPEMRRIVADATAPLEIRAEALAGLAKAIATPENHAAVRAALASSEPKLRREALRALRGAFDAEDAKAVEAWLPTLKPSVPEQAELIRQAARLPQLTAAAELAKQIPATTNPPFGAQGVERSAVQALGDANAGRRLFYHPEGPRCFTCHAIESRGGAVGPDLTPIWRLEPAKVYEAIHEPSKEVAPAFTQWMLTMRDGTVATGIDRFEDNKSQTVLIDATGKITKYANDKIVTREALPVSIMPPGLDLAMTEQELRDLLAYLLQERD